MKNADANLFDELQWRGMVSDATEGLKEQFAAERVTAYIGFDPTASSLHVGNLMTLMALARLQRFGHCPIAIVGGGTGMIGDPSGKSQERNLLSAEQIAINVAGVRAQLERFLDFTPAANAATIVNNADWLGAIDLLSYLRDVGKHFTVNYMLQKESVSRRIESADGISYTEFSYLILQAYDFLHLYEKHGVTVQVGGSDQWGNIVSGVELVRKKRGAEVFGMTVPLLTKSDGGKFGKTESGAVWLTQDRTSPYAFHQFWLNAADADVLRLLKNYTFIEREAIEALAVEHDTAPEKRVAQRALADHMTELVHGKAALEQARRSAEALFSGDVSGLDEQSLDQVFHDAPSTALDRGALSGQGVLLVELLVNAGVASSKRESRQLLESGAISLNGQRVELERRLVEADLLHGKVALVRRGRKSWHVLRFN
jgi:tyrosyl-tRNA synthetase